MIDFRVDLVLGCRVLVYRRIPFDEVFRTWPSSPCDACKVKHPSEAVEVKFVFTISRPSFLVVVLPHPSFPLNRCNIQWPIVTSLVVRVQVRTDNEGQTALRSRHLTCGAGHTQSCAVTCATQCWCVHCACVSHSRDKERERQTHTEQAIGS